MTSREELKAIQEQVDAIFALEGFQKTETSRLMDKAVLDGRVTHRQIVEEMVAYVHEHKSLDGFAESRSWL